MTNKQKLYEFKKALESFIPYVGSIEDQMVLLDGKVTQLIMRRDELELVNKKKMEDCDNLVNAQKKESQDALNQAKASLKDAYDIYLQAFKMKTTQQVLSKEELQKKINFVEAKLKPKEAVTGPVA